MATAKQSKSPSSVAKIDVDTDNFWHSVCLPSVRPSNVPTKSVAVAASGKKKTKERRNRLRVAERDIESKVWQQEKRLQSSVCLGQSTHVRDCNRVRAIFKRVWDDSEVCNCDLIVLPAFTV